MKSAPGQTALWRGFPRRQVIDAADRIVCDACQSVGQKCLRTDTVQLGGFDQGASDGSGFAAGLRSDKQVGFALMQRYPYAQFDVAHLRDWAFAAIGSENFTTRRFKVA